MATKKKRGLSGAQEDRAKIADIDAVLETSIEQLDLARRLAGNGECNDAFDFYGYGRDNFGKYEIQREGLDKNPADDIVRKMRRSSAYLHEKQIKNLDDATAALKKHCLVGGGLSGMKRRGRK